MYSKNVLIYIVVNCFVIHFSNCDKNEDVWEQDMSDVFKIDPSTQGLQKVHLKCGAESMLVELETEQDFNGVMYTKGSFYKQSEPCFVKPEIGKKTRSLKMRFPLNQCQTLQNGEIYSNIIIVQHGPDLVMPGDAAFAVECDFRKPRSVNVGADMQTRDRIAYSSRITLTSPDPSAIPDSDKITENEHQTFFSESDEVSFMPSRTEEKKVKGTVETVKLDRQTRQDEL